MPEMRLWNGVTMINTKKVKEIIRELCDADNRHTMAECVTLSFMQSLHELSLIDTQSGYGYREVTDTIGEEIN